MHILVDPRMSLQCREQPIAVHHTMVRYLGSMSVIYRADAQITESYSRTRPGSVGRHCYTAVIRTAGPLRNLPDALGQQFGQSGRLYI